jgi:hypothetical protein
LDLFCGQEHHLRDGEVKAIKREVWRDAEIIISPAVDGRRALSNPSVIAGKGGLFLAISPLLAIYIQDKGIIDRGLGVWCTFKHPHLGCFGVIGVYAPTTTQERTTLWLELFTFLDNSLPWILLGDLNMVETPKTWQVGNYVPSPTSNAK